jgi:L-alanine-DL-glutamate epimerase-like enolase superfamily enzyme
MAPIKSVEYFRVKPRWLMVKITDENGASGWGEATLEGHDLAVEGCLEEMIVRLIGMEAKYDSPGSISDAELMIGFLATLSTFGKHSGDTASTAADPSSCLPCLVSTLRCGT